MKYLYLLVAAVILIAATPTQAQAAPDNQPMAQGVLTLKPNLPGEAVLAAGHGNHGRNDRDRNRNRNSNPNRDDRRGWQRNDNPRRGEQRGGFWWTPPWRWFLRWQFSHGGQGNRGHRGH